MNFDDSNMIAVDDDDDDDVEEDNKNLLLPAGSMSGDDAVHVTPTPPTSNVAGGDSNSRSGTSAKKTVVIDSSTGYYNTTKSRKHMKRSYEYEHFLYRQHCYYSNMNAISYGPGRQWYAWGVVMSILSVICFCGAVVIVCVQKFHRWTPYSDKLQFLGPCFFGLWVALIGGASFMFYKAYKKSCQARRSLRLKGTFEGNGVYLVNPSVEQDAPGGTMSSKGTQLKTGQKTEQAIGKVDYEAYYARMAQNRVYQPSQVSTPTSSIAGTNTPWAQSSLPRLTPDQQQSPFSTPPAGSLFSKSKKRKIRGYGLPPLPTGGTMQTVDEDQAVQHQEPLPSTSSSPVTERSGFERRPSAEGKLDLAPSSAPSVSDQMSSVSGDSSRAKKSAVSQMPISHQKTSFGASIGGIGGLSSVQRPKPKITGVSSLGGTSTHSSGSSSAAKPAP